MNKKNLNCSNTHELHFVVTSTEGKTFKYSQKRESLFIKINCLCIAKIF